MARAASVFTLQALLLAGAQQQQPQKISPPKWLPDDGKDLFNDIEADERVYGDAACENREKLLKFMAGKGEKDAAEYRYRTLFGLGLCEFRKERFDLSQKRLDSAISELNAPSEDALLKNPNLAPTVLLKQSASFMSKYEVSQAGTQLRRCREVLDRNLKQVIKMVHSQMPKGAPPVEKMLEELPGLGKTGQFLPMIIKQVPMLGESFALAELVDNSLDALDKRMSASDSSLKGKRSRLEQSKGFGKGGSLLYVRALVTDAIIGADRLSAAQELLSSGVSKAFLKEAASLEKAVGLIKRSKPGTGCKDDKGLESTCNALQKVADIQSNTFGETRVVVIKGKKQALEVCSTNANVGILLATKDGATLTIAGQTDSVQLPAGKPVVFDFCQEASLESDGLVPVLFAQAWHPEFAAVERTTEIRARKDSFGLSEDEVKAVTKVVNDNAKKSWEKSAKLWRADSSSLANIQQAFKSQDDSKQKEKNAAQEASLQAAEAGDEERKKALEELEKKREAKRQAAARAEEKRLARKKQLEEEKAKRDPWLNFPEVISAEAKLQELRESRRDANAKLEFDLSTQLTKDISAAERTLKKTIKKAKKVYEKDGVVPTGPASSEEQEKPDTSSSEKVTTLKKQLEEVKEKKAKATEAENFKEAKQLKKEQQELEEQLRKLEL